MITSGIIVLLTVAFAVSFLQIRSLVSEKVELEKHNELLQNRLHDISSNENNFEVMEVDGKSCIVLNTYAAKKNYAMIGSRKEEFYGEYFLSWKDGSKASYVSGGDNIFIFQIPGGKEGNTDFEIRGKDKEGRFISSDLFMQPIVAGPGKDGTYKMPRKMAFKNVG